MVSDYLEAPPRRLAYVDVLHPSGDYRVEVSGQPGHYIVRTDRDALRLARALAGDTCLIARGLRKGARR